MIRTFEVGSGTGKVRADKWIASQITEISRNDIQRAFEENLVQVNGRVVSKSFKVRGGDRVEFKFPEIKQLDLMPKEIPLDILFEDEHMLALNKSTGMVVHPGAGTSEDTLIHALLHYCKGQLSGIGGVERPGIVHRLDRQTSGVMVVAKTDRAHRALSAAFAKRDLQKNYLALVAGIPDRLSGSIKEPIGRHPVHRHKMTIREDGKLAHTNWELIGSRESSVSLLRCQIHTGRTHQIRVHLSNMGFPILGDKVYGFKAERINLNSLPDRVMLHAYRLELNHPISNEPLKLSANPPPDFERLYSTWSNELEDSDNRSV